MPTPDLIALGEFLITCLSLGLSWTTPTPALTSSSFLLSSPSVDIMTPSLDTTAIPGTVTLVDLEHIVASRHARGDSDIVLIPEPSNDPDDPLNWAPWRKTLSTTCVSVYASRCSVWSTGLITNVPDTRCLLALHARSFTRCSRRSLRKQASPSTL